MNKPRPVWYRKRQAALCKLGWSKEEATVKEWLRILKLMYFTEEMSFTCIGDRFDMTGPTIRNDFQRFGMQARPRGGSISNLYGKKFTSIYSELCLCGKQFKTARPDQRRCPDCAKKFYKPKREAI